MDSALTMHLTWEPARAVEARDAVAALMEHPGWAFVLEAVQQRRSSQMDALAHENPTDTGAVYAAALAEIRTLGDFPRIAEGVIEYGQNAAEELRELQAA